MEKGTGENGELRVRDINVDGIPEKFCSKLLDSTGRISNIFTCKQIAEDRCFPGSGDAENEERLVVGFSGAGVRRGIRVQERVSKHMKEAPLQAHEFNLVCT